ncbi:acyl carrier protein [Candidatus Daviesbacteria bacterium]|nr:acyl carrier protein [Candidatus Daviesbacteria bacterium]
MPTNREILETIAEHLGLSAEDLDKQSLLREDLGLGPIELNDLLHELSQKYNITFEPEDVENLQKLEDLLVLVEDNSLE